jgi:transcriptional regulator with GAF, ATPase, and Fis domain
VITDSELRQRERGNLETALRRASWKIYGPDGAALMLGMKPTTLASRMKALGIRRPR